MSYSSMSYTTVHGSTRHSQKNIEQQTTPNAVDVAIEQAIHPGGSFPEFVPVKITGEVQNSIADTATYRTVTLNTANPYSMILPQDPDRYRAQVIASNSAIYLAENRDLAMAVNGGNTSAGALLPSSVPIVLRNTWEVYAVNSASATAATVTVIVERYANCPAQ